MVVVVEGETEGVDDCAACEMRNHQDSTSKHTRHKVNKRPEEWVCTLTGQLENRL
jgi:hypothetical protein